MSNINQTVTGTITGMFGCSGNNRTEDENPVEHNASTFTWSMVARARSCGPKWSMWNGSPRLLLYHGRVCIATTG